MWADRGAAREPRHFSVFRPLPAIQAAIRDRIYDKLAYQQTLPQKGHQDQARYDQDLMDATQRDVMGDARAPNGLLLNVDGATLPVSTGGTGSRRGTLLNAMKHRMDADDQSDAARANRSSAMSSATWSAVKAAVSNKRKYEETHEMPTLTSDAYVASRPEDGYAPGPPPAFAAQMPAPKMPRPIVDMPGAGGDNADAGVVPYEVFAKGTSHDQADRLAAISRLMKERGMTLGEASHYVKEHGFESSKPQGVATETTNALGNVLKAVLPSETGRKLEAAELPQITSPNEPLTEEQAKARAKQQEEAGKPGGSNKKALAKLTDALLGNGKPKRQITEAQRKRAELVGKLMKARGMKLGEASKYIKDHPEEFAAGSGWAAGAQG